LDTLADYRVMSSLVLLVCGACVVATGAIGFFSRVLAAKLDLMDVPDSRKHHATPTPLAGGLALTLVILPLAIIATLFEPPSALQPTQLVILLSSAAMTLLGMADDRHTLSARDRLLVSFLVFGSAAIIDPVLNVRVLTFNFPQMELGLGTSALAVAFTSLCGVGLVNALNMADGKNGLAIGLCIGWLVALAGRAPVMLLPVILILISGLVSLLAFNLKGRLFLGDGGAYGLAAAVALVSIAVYNTPNAVGPRSLPAEQLVLLFLIPVVDSFRLTFSRWRRGQSPMAPDRDHLHHHLQSGLGWPAGLVAYLVLAMLPYLGFLIGPRAGIAGLALSIVSYTGAIYHRVRHRALPDSFLSKK
jgi:UDP-GlcNAc:undecaprenyl-phosphate/decaprenyl-phosphate GlcNAc-1-phosphate transferase